MSDYARGVLALYIGGPIETFDIETDEVLSVSDRGIQEVEVVGRDESRELICAEHGAGDLWFVRMDEAPLPTVVCGCQLIPLEGFEPRADEEELPGQIKNQYPTEGAKT